MFLFCFVFAERWEKRMGYLRVFEVERVEKESLSIQEKDNDSL